ncbi:MAG: oligosaccharide flippase family protein [Candidatus Roizmanbacteria bacterium]|nr:oligosaccharide flippase family protein [Candidatus Roizmanbacteria bacterium]
MRQLIHRVSSNPFVQGGAIVTAGNIVISLLNYLFNSLAGKQLGPEGYGEIAAFFSYTAILTVPTSIIGSLIIRRLGQAGQDRVVYAHALEQWFLTRLRTWGFIAFIPILAIPFLPAITNLSLASATGLALIIPLVPLIMLYASMVQGLQLFIGYTTVLIVAATIKLLGIIIVIPGIDSLWRVIGFLLLSYIATWLISLYIVHKKKLPYIAITGHTIIRRIRDILSDHTLVISMFALLAITLLGNADVIAAKKVMNSQESGLYSAWSLFAKMILYAGGPLSMVSYIFFSDIEKKAQHRKALLILTSLVIIGGLLVYGAYSMLGDTLLHFFLSNKFSIIIPLLPYAALFGTFYLLVSIYTHYFVATQNSLSLIPAATIPFYFVAIVMNNASFNSLIATNCIYAVVVCLLMVGGFIFRK